MIAPRPAIGSSVVPVTAKFPPGRRDKFSAMSIDAILVLAILV